MQTRCNSNNSTNHDKSDNADDTPPKKTPGPLRILFCGSDHFSCASLSALHALHKARPDLIESIDVLVRPGKPAGRGLKRIAVGPLFHLANDLDLPLHQQDTFRGWTLPLPGRVTSRSTNKVTIHPHPLQLPHLPRTPRSHAPFNLLIAVSFGLFVPPRILNTLHYGGLNIHPSLLPDLRGPAPIPWAILLQRPHTGVTLQTLHPTAYDHGAILAQTPRPGVPIDPHTATTAALLDELAGAGADMLVRGLEAGVHVDAPPPRSSIHAADRAKVGTETLTRPTTAVVRDAHKITKADLAVDWGSEYWASDEALGGALWGAADLARRFRALVVTGAGGDGRAKKGGGGGLWTYAYTVRQPTEVRLIFEEVEAVRCPDALRRVVRSVLRAKRGLVGEDEGDLPVGAEERSGRPKGDGTPEEKRAEKKRVNKVGSVAFCTQKIAMDARIFRMPVYALGGKSEDAHSVIIPIRVAYRIVDGDVVMADDDEKSEVMDAIRVRTIKAEGNASEKASKALKPLWEGNLRMQDLVRMDYALDVMAKRVD